MTAPVVPDLSPSFASLRLGSGHRLANRWGVAPLTNQQSHADGTLSEEEFRWLTMRGAGGFGLTMTCAAHVMAAGQGFPGQLGIWGDHQLPGLIRLASALRASGTVSLVQLHHAGFRAPPTLTGRPPVGPSSDASTGAVALTLVEVGAVRDAFIAAAARAQRAGFDGVELHGAHGYLLSSFLSPVENQRTDGYGGARAGRWRLLFEILDGVRAACGAGFVVAVRISPERFGLDVEEQRALFLALDARADVDLIDVSMWDVFKRPEDPTAVHTDLLRAYTTLPRGHSALAVAGKVATPADVAAVLAAGADVALLGRGAILHHDYPRRTAVDATFRPRSLPVSAGVLAAEGLSATFVDYMRRWKGFVAEAEPSLDDEDRR
ncbi:MAG: hypothetical protein RLZZ383_662 [Pseudomonadota bacterium]